MPDAALRGRARGDRRRRDRRGRRDEHARPRPGDGGRHAAGRGPRRRLDGQPARPREARLSPAPPLGVGSVGHPPPWRRGYRSKRHASATPPRRVCADFSRLHWIRAGDALRLERRRRRARGRRRRRPRVAPRPAPLHDPAARQPADARGRRRHVVEARAVVDELVELVEGGHEIGPSTVDAVLGALDQAADIRDVFDDVVWRHRGKKIAPKTVMQKSYVDAIRELHGHVRDRAGRHGQDLPRDRARGRGALRALRSGGSSSRARPSRPASGSASSPATCSRRSTRTCARSSTRSTTRWTPRS